MNCAIYLVSTNRLHSYTIFCKRKVQIEYQIANKIQPENREIELFCSVFGNRQYWLKQTAEPSFADQSQDITNSVHGIFVYRHKYLSIKSACACAFKNVYPTLSFIPAILIKMRLSELYPIQPSSKTKLCFFENLF